MVLSGVLSAFFKKFSFLPIHLATVAPPRGDFDVARLVDTGASGSQGTGVLLIIG